MNPAARPKRLAILGSTGSIGTQTLDEIVLRVMALSPGTPIIILAPISLGDGESYAGLFNRLKSSGYTRVRIDGEIRLTAEATTLDARRKHRVEVVIDRTVVRARARSRISESVEHALALGNGVMTLLVEEVEELHEHEGESPAAGAEAPGERPRYRVEKRPAEELMFSQKLACTRCGRSFEELGPVHFSFNSQLGWCETCEGLGVQRGAPAAAIIWQPSKSLLEGAIAGWHRILKRTPLGRMLVALCGHLGVREAPGVPDAVP
jgi:excinuclease ABC subunit A